MLLCARWNGTVECTACRDGSGKFLECLSRPFQIWDRGLKTYSVIVSSCFLRGGTMFYYQRCCSARTASSTSHVFPGCVSSKWGLRLLHVSISRLFRQRQHRRTLPWMLYRLGDTVKDRVVFVIALKMASQFQVYLCTTNPFALVSTLKPSTFPRSVANVFMIGSSLGGYLSLVADPHRSIHATRIVNIFHPLFF